MADDPGARGQERDSLLAHGRRDGQHTGLRGDDPQDESQPAPRPGGQRRAEHRKPGYHHLQQVQWEQDAKPGPQVDRQTSCPEGGPTTLPEMVGENHDYRGEWK